MVSKVTNAMGSRTTQNVAAGSGVAMAAAVALVSFLRAVGWTWWGEESDMEVSGYLALALTPVFSRVLALLRNPEKKAQAIRGAVVLLCCGLAVGASGCMTPGGGGWIRPAAGDHSSATLVFDEESAAGDSLRIEYKVTGEATQTAGVQYRGEGSEPWELSVLGDGLVTSPQAEAVAAGYASLLEQTPATIEALAGQIGAIMALPEPEGGGGGNWKRTLVRWAMERFFGGGGGMVPIEGL